ncbi:MAG: 4Fe-4S binding protein [Candidatus Cloacimonetes bacterium]|nr:4Fe-4S binding protein [Candidatus Cloacimonadota bacterium]
MNSQSKGGNKISVKKRYLLFFTILIFIITSIFAFSNLKIFVDQNSCVGCADCTKFCPVGAITIIDGKAKIDQEKCIECKLCLKICTYNAIRSGK